MARTGELGNRNRTTERTLGGAAGIRERTGPCPPCPPGGLEIGAATERQGMSVGTPSPPRVPFGRSGRRPNAFEAGEVLDFSWRADRGRSLVWGPAASDRLFVRDLRAGTLAEVRVEDDRTGRLAVFPDGHRAVRVNKQYEVTVVDLGTGGRDTVVGTLDFGGHSPFYMVRAVALTADGAWLAGQTSAVPVWDVEARRLLFRLPPTQAIPTALAWAPDRDLLAVGSRDGELVVWDVVALRARLRALGLDW